MNSEQFVSAVRKILREQVIEGQMRSIVEPPGRRPSEYHKKRSQWYHSLSPESQSYVRCVLADGFDAAIFSLFVVLDGGSTLEEPSETRGHFELTYVDMQGNRTLLNSDEASLHEFYN
jgi:hypothetical protein